MPPGPWRGHLVRGEGNGKVCFALYILKALEYWDKDMRLPDIMEGGGTGHESHSREKKARSGIHEAISQRCAQQPCAKGVEKERNHCDKGVTWCCPRGSLLGTRSLFPRL